MSTAHRSVSGTVWLAVVAVVALVSSVASYQYLPDHLFAERGSLYALLFVAPIGVLAIVDLVGAGRRDGTTYRAVLGAGGFVAALVEYDEVGLDTAFVSAYVLYALVCALALANTLSARR